MPLLEIEIGADAWAMRYQLTQRNHPGNRRIRLLCFWETYRATVRQFGTTDRRILDDRPQDWSLLAILGDDALEPHRPCRASQHQKVQREFASGAV